MSSSTVSDCSDDEDVLLSFSKVLIYLTNFLYVSVVLASFELILASLFISFLYLSLDNFYVFYIYFSNFYCNLNSLFIKDSSLSITLLINFSKTSTYPSNPTEFFLFCNFSNNINPSLRSVCLYYLCFLVFSTIFL